MKRLLYLVILTGSLCVAMCCIPFVYPFLLPTATAMPLPSAAGEIQLPAAYLYQENGSIYVFLFSDGKAVRQLVCAEQESAAYWCLQSTLPQDSILLAGTALEDGMHVRIY